MIRPVIDYKSCQACQPCEARTACKTRAIVKIEPDEPPYIDFDRCNGCSACVLACPYGVISMRLAGNAVICG